MNSIPLREIKNILSEENHIIFALIFGSGKYGLKPDSDLDIAVYFDGKYDIEQIYRLIQRIDDVLGKDSLDLLVLNGCEDFILRSEVIKGDLIFCRNIDIYAAFFSWTLRMYEDEMLRYGII